MFGIKKKLKTIDPNDVTVRMPNSWDYGAFYSCNAELGSSDGSLTYCYESGWRKENSVAINPYGKIEDDVLKVNDPNGGYCPMIVIKHDSDLFKVVDLTGGLVPGSEFTMTNQKYEQGEQKGKAITYRIERKDPVSIVLRPTNNIAYGPLYESGEYGRGPCMADEIIKKFKEEFLTAANELIKPPKEINKAAPSTAPVEKAPSAEPVEKAPATELAATAHEEKQSVAEQLQNSPLRPVDELEAVAYKLWKDHPYANVCRDDFLKMAKIELETKKLEKELEKELETLIKEKPDDFEGIKQVYEQTAKINQKIKENKNLIKTMLSKGVEPNITTKQPPNL